MIEQQPTPITLEETAIQELASRLRGVLIRPGDTGRLPVPPSSTVNR